MNRNYQSNVRSNHKTIDNRFDSKEDKKFQSDLEKINTIGNLMDINLQNGNYATAFMLAGNYGNLMGGQPNSKYSIDVASANEMILNIARHYNIAQQAGISYLNPESGKDISYMNNIPSRDSKSYNPVPKSAGPSYKANNVSPCDGKYSSKGIASSYKGTSSSSSK